MVKLRIVICAAALIACVSALPSAGCKEEPKCREACIHACEICGQPCDLSDPVIADDLDVCQENCETSAVPPWRAECILNTDFCEDLWKC